MSAQQGGGVFGGTHYCAAKADVVRAQRRGGGLRLGRIQVQQRDLGAVFGKQLRGGQADATRAGRAGDHRHAALQQPVHATTRIGSRPSQPAAASRIWRKNSALPPLCSDTSITLPGIAACT